MNPNRRVIGQDPFGVKAYATPNVKNDHIENGIYFGIKWECVEYARRWLITVHGLTFPSIPNAIDIWGLSYLIQLRTNHLVPFLSIPVSSDKIPTIGDLLIYGTCPLYPHGHVSVVVLVTPYYIGIAEQNISDDLWTGSCARYIPIRSLKSEPALIGWKTY